MTGRAVAVTGLGLVTSLGRGVAANWRRLVAGESGIRRIDRFPVDGLRASVAALAEPFGNGPFRAPEHATALAVAVAEEALAAAGHGAPFDGLLVVAAPPVEQEWADRLALGLGDPPGYDAILRRLPAPGVFPDLLFGIVAERLATRFGTAGAPVTVNTACASGASAIQIAVEALRRGESARALVVGTDGSVNAENLIRFALLSALSPGHDACCARPFAKSRDGFVMGEGAAALVLETAPRGAPVGWVLGCGESADTFHRTRSHPSGDAIAGAIAGALADAGRDPGAVDHVNAHGTGTPENDKMEALGLERVFGARTPALPVTANKSMIGHTLSAAGAIEAAVALLTIRHGVIPPTVNLDDPDPAIALDVVANRARAMPVRTVLSNSFGFGGQNVSLLLGAAP